MVKSLKEELHDLADWSEIFWERFKERMGGDLSTVRLLGMLIVMVIVALVGGFVIGSQGSILSPVFSKIAPVAQPTLTPTVIPATPLPAPTFAPTVKPTAVAVPTEQTTTSARASPTAQQTPNPTAKNQTLGGQYNPGGQAPTPKPVPEVDFSASPTSGMTPLAVSFTDHSTRSPTSWEWNFGDGSAHSTEKNPTHTYTSGGVFTVTLKATNGDGSGTASKTGYITVTSRPGAPTANFREDTISGHVPLTVSFTDTSSGSPTSWSWDFGDNSADSAQQSPSHTFSTAGTYQVVLTATNAGGSHTSSPHTITVIPDRPVVDFAVDQNSGNAPLTVNFQGSGTNSPTSWSWNFGDGSTGSGQYTQHTFTSVGTWTVTLTASNAGGNGGMQHTITVNAAPTPTPTPVATITSPSSAQTGTAPLKVNFQGSGTNSPTSWSWNFGTGEGTSTQQNPGDHTFNNPGIYDVTLTATNGGGTSPAAHVTITVNSPTGGPTAGISAPSSTYAGDNVQFTDASTGSPNTWDWNFGDGGTSSDRNPIHVYTTGGSKTVTLHVTNSGGSDSTTANIDVTMPTCSIGGPGSANEGDSVTFTGSVSHGTPDSWTWSGDDDISGSGSSTSHTYDIGSYVIHLVAHFAGFDVNADPFTINIVNGAG